MSFFISTRNAERKKYQPNLVSLMTLCANNYMLLNKVQAGKTEKGDLRQFFISDTLFYTIFVKEVTPYTSLITIEQKKLTGLSALTKALKSSLHPRMSIRLYHDAQMAEVISTQDVQQVKPRYDYPNVYMHQQDEKQQINQFLNEWLQLCLKFGQVNVELAP